jgi:hypothetical protein
MGTFGVRTIVFPTDFSDCSRHAGGRAADVGTSVRGSTFCTSICRPARPRRPRGFPQPRSPWAPGWT